MKTAARKILVKLTPVVNFINVKSANFSYERRFGSFFLVTRTYKNDIRTKDLRVLH